MANFTVEQPIKRALFKLMALWPWMGGCSAMTRTDTPAGDPLQRRFRGIGLVLVVDAVPGAAMHGVVFQDDRAREIYVKSLVSRHTREIMALSSTHVPITVHAVWGEHRHYDFSRGTWYGGTIVGDYTIPVAERIPDAVLNDIRAHGGALRLKFRLKPDGVLFGWDIERDGAGTGYVFRYDMSGGDFKEARIFNGKVAERGWQVMPDGQKIDTDY